MENESLDPVDTLQTFIRETEGPAPPGRPVPAAFAPVSAPAPPPAPASGSAAPRQELLRGIHLKVRAELGRSRLLLRDALELVPGSIVDLEKLVDDPVDLYVGDLLIARGEVLVLNDSFCIRVTEVFSQVGSEEGK